MLMSVSLHTQAHVGERVKNRSMGDITAFRVCRLSGSKERHFSLSRDMFDSAGFRQELKERKSSGPNRCRVARHTALSGAIWT